MRLATILCALAIAAMAAAQSPRAHRIAIRHADPWFVKAMLEGMPVRSPEQSTLPGFGAAAGAAVQAANRLLRDGRLVVNPTDNSLWWFPDA